jgi:hypothetical protein
MPKAVLLLHRRRYYDDGAISEVKLWLLAAPVPGSMHRFKYTLVDTLRRQESDDDG